MLDDELVELAPQRMLRGDAKVAADIDDDSTDRPMTNFSCDLLRGGEIGQTVAMRVSWDGWFGARGRTGFGLLPSCVKARSIADDARFERLGAA